MKKINVITGISSLVLCVSLSCTTEKENVSPLVDEKSELSEVIISNLNDVAESLRKSNQTFSNAQLVLKLAKQNLKTKYGANSDVMGAYTQAFNKSKQQNLRKNEKNQFSDQANQFLTKIDKSATLAKNLKSYKDQLSLIKNDIIYSGLSNEEKTILQVKITALKTSLTFVAKNFDLFLLGGIANARADDSEWWDDWGKCASGIVGGAMTGGLVGCGIGAAVAVIGCGVGAVIGCIGAGLTGVMAGC